MQSFCSLRQLQEIKFAIRLKEKPSQQGLKHKISRLIFKLIPGKGFALPNILLLIYTPLLLLQFLMNPLVTSAKIWTKALLGILNQNVYPEMQSLNCT